VIMRATKGQSHARLGMDPGRLRMTA
jgi:hypothetical protein